MTMSELQVSRLWQYGPDWLKSSLTLNDADDPTGMLEECSKELKPSNEKTHTLAATGVEHTVG